MEYRIGDFSLVSRLPVKTLRYYHEIGILEPAGTDPMTGYRWYDDESLRKAALVKRLRELDFSLEEIADIARREAEGRTDEGLERLAAKAFELGERIERFQQIKAEIDGFIAAEREAEEAGKLESIESIEIDGQLIAKIGYRGKYSDFGRYVARLSSLRPLDGGALLRSVPRGRIFRRGRHRRVPAAQAGCGKGRGRAYRG